MWQISEAYRQASLSKSLEPVFVAKIINDNATIYLTTRNISIVDVGSTQLHGVIKSATFNSQSIKPEDGLSSVGGMNIDFDDTDRSFNAVLSAIDAAGGSIINNKVELYAGFADIAFSDYVQLTPLYIRTFSNSEISIKLTLTDIQRITKKSLFADPKITELVGNYGFENTSTIEVISPAGFPLVEHNADWSVDPNKTVGYLKVFGLSKDGREVKEVISYTGFTTTHFTGVSRGVMGTERVDLSATDDDGNPVSLELTEMVYIDLVQPAMVLALLTGDLYGQVGKTLPGNWHAGIDASLINTVSFDEASGSLWQEHVEFRDLESTDAKEFIAEQCLAPYGSFLRIDQNGQYELAAYDYVSQQTGGLVTLTYDELISLSEVKRDAQGIKNAFQISWGWRIDQDYYARNDFYIDGNSQTKYQVESELEVIELRGLRNRDKNSKPSLDFVAQSLIKRKSNPAITRTAVVNLTDSIGLEVGDLITLVADNEQDFRTSDTYSETFEIQSVIYDFFANRATFKLFASEGVPSEFIVANGSNVASIGRTGWSNLDGSGYGSVSGGVFQFNNGANVPNGKYYYDGDIELPATRGITVNGSVYIDCDNVYLGSNTLIDGIGRGNAIDAGYFGGGNSSQGGLRMRDGGFFGANQLRYLGGQSVISNGNTTVSLADVIRVTDGQQIDGLIPSKLYGMAGAKGGDNFYNDLSYTGSIAGGAAVKGGAGLFFSCTGFQYESSAVINLSGADSNVGGSSYRPITSGPYAPFDQYFHAGSSGYGWCGVCIVALKDLGAAKPFLYDLVVAKTGAFNQATRQNPSIPLKTRSSTDNQNISAIVGDYYPTIRYSNTSQANKDFATEANRSAIKVINLVVADDQVNDPVLDQIGSSPAPTISTTQYLNTPRTALGDQVTYELTATDDPDTKYVQFEYRLLPDGDFNAAKYKLSNESTITETGTGDTYEIRATSYNQSGKAGGTTITQITFPNITNNADDSDASLPDAPTDITLPDIKGLELVNRINNDDWNNFKSGNAEFRWKKLSNTSPSSLGNLNGVTDSYLKGYKVRITDTSGNILREEIVTDTFYTYTYDKNKKDTNGSPVRDFRIDVQPISNTGYVGSFVGFEVNNPAPSAPANTQFNAGFTSIEAAFNLPNDVDFVGVDAFIVEGVGDPYTTGESKRVAGNSIVWDGLTAGVTYTIGLRSVDQFGNGDQITATGIQTNLIQSSALGSITTPLVIDEVGGRLITNNSGYVAFHGATDVPSVSGNPLIFGAFDGTDYPFWVDSAGNSFFSGNIEASSYKSSLSGKRIEINASGSNEIEFFDSSGSSALTIGSNSDSVGTYALYTDEDILVRSVKVDESLNTASNEYTMQSLTGAITFNSAGTIIKKYSIGTFLTGKQSTGIYRVNVSSALLSAASIAAGQVVATAWSGSTSYNVTCSVANSGSVFGSGSYVDIYCRRTDTDALVDPSYLFVRLYNLGGYR